MFPKVSLILGGASSGKSQVGEDLVTAKAGRHVYLASAQALDDEMTARITRHRTSRGAGWHTVEVPLDVVGALDTCRAGDVVLFDCATLWLSNQMLAKHDLAREQDALVRALIDCRAPVVVISNEVGHGIVPGDALSRAFRDAQGVLNQRLAACADLVVMVTAGLPMVLKGTLPR